jgi:tetratricopeptide (TPR) repeat protein
MWGTGAFFYNGPSLRAGLIQGLMQRRKTGPASRGCGRTCVPAGVRIRVISKDYSTLVREAHELKAAGRLDEAAARYGEAVAANPRSAVAEHNLAACLGDAGHWAEAEPHISAAFGKGLDAPETWLMKARAEQALAGQDAGRLDKAEKAFREALKRRGDMYDAHRELSQLIWMRTGDAAASMAEVEKALKANPGHVGLNVVKAQTLEFAGRADEAFSLMSQMADANPGEPGLSVQAAQLATTLGRGDVALGYAQRAQAAAPQDLGVMVTLTEALLAAGEAERASDMAGDIRRKWSTNQHAIALQATAWRMMGDPRYRRLYDYDTLVGASMLDTPNGWSSLEAYMADVASALKSLHAFREHPFNQSLRHGSQAVDILRQSHPALRALPQALDGPIRKHLAQLGQGDDPVRARNRGTYQFHGMWSVRLRPGGYHVDHVHPQGWLSSACYVETVAPKGQEGWIRFGQPGVKTRPALPAEHHVEPKPGMLVLFPSYMWHGTVPFTGDQTRLTFAFDLVPGAVDLSGND